MYECLQSYYIGCIGLMSLFSKKKKRKEKKKEKQTQNK